MRRIFGHCGCLDHQCCSGGWHGYVGYHLYHYVTDDSEHNPGSGDRSSSVPSGQVHRVTKSLRTAVGEVEVTFKLYSDITYVTRPVDPAYQCLHVCVPLKIGGVEVDASNAPIFLAIEVAGYWASKMGGAGGVLGPNASLALASGFVVVCPGCRGSDNVASDGTYYGKAPAAIVDLKSAVRYLHHNDAVMPGDAKKIVSAGGSAGGALSALLGSSGDSELYKPCLDELGAADASDAIFASGCFCPVVDLENADGAYEWMFGTMPLKTGLVDQKLSAELKQAFAEYQLSLGLQGKNGFGTVTAENYDDYLLQTYLVPAATRYLTDLSEEKRAQYLAENPWISWVDGKTSFSWNDYLKHFEKVVGRKYDLPAFDSFSRDSYANLLFGDSKTNGRHFTDFSLRHTTGNPNAAIDDELKKIVKLMNPMYFLSDERAGCAEHWWIRHGTLDPYTSLTVIANLVLALENLGKDVNALMYWDARHGANLDPTAFMQWISDITGYRIAR
ncbi:MAG: alpha/beta hydrolase [Thermoleophilia bacterium]|nr:alpha/beta hydrolase [Thermoleophilia bacterium]